MIEIDKRAYNSILNFSRIIYKNAVLNKEDLPDKEQIIKLYYKNKFVAKAIYDSGAPTIKILTLKDEEINKDFFYNRIKKAKDYIHDNRWRNEYCKLAKKLNFINELKILGILECCLLNRQIDTFRQTLKKYRKEILDWSLMNILNAYELAIYTKNNEIIQEVEDMLFIRNIEKCNGLYEFDYFMLLQHIKNRQTEKITEYLRKLKNIFDTCLLEWFYVLVENKEFTFA